MSRSRGDDDELDQIVGSSETEDGTTAAAGRVRGGADTRTGTKSSKPKSKKRTMKASGSDDVGSGENRKGIVQESRFPSMKTIFIQTRTSLNPIWLWGQGMRTLLLHRSTWSAGLPYLIVGLLLAFIGEIMKHGPQHNVVVLLVLMAAFAFPNFPDKTVRPQLVIVLITFISFMLDAIVFGNPLIDIGVKAVTAMVFLAKGLALYQFLWYTKNAAKARKYFVRRVRVFLIPWARPKNIMRELRSRILAIEVLQFACIIAYITLFFVAIIHLGYSDLVTGPRRGVALAAFLPLKTVSSGVVFYGLLTDTDPILCLAHFGILGGCMKSVKAYVKKKFDEYDGWPLAYGLNKYRFYVVTFIKFGDWCWGLAGWAALGTVLGDEYYGMGDSLKAFVGCTIFVLCLSDIYIPILFGVVFWLMKENKHRMDVIVREHKGSGEMTAEFNDGDHASDDSELDDFGFRAAVASTDADVEHSGELGQARGTGSSRSPDRFARASRADYSKNIRWDDDEEPIENAEPRKKKKKKHKSNKKHRKHHHRYSSGSEEEGGDEEEEYTREAQRDEANFGSSRTSSNVAQSAHLQSLVDDDIAPRYMLNSNNSNDGTYGYPDASLDEFEGAENTIKFTHSAPAPPTTTARSSRGAFVSPRSCSSSGGVGMAPPPAPLPALHQATSPQNRRVIKVPPLQFRRSNSDIGTGAGPYPNVAFSRPLIGSQNSMGEKAVAENTFTTNKANSLPARGEESVLDWRSGPPSTKQTSPRNTSPENKDKVHRSPGIEHSYSINADTDGGVSPPGTAAAIVFLSREISADEYSSYWESLGAGQSAQYELSASSALSKEEMLVVIIDHLKSTGFGIAASGAVDVALTVFCYASCENRRDVSLQPDLFLMEIKLVQIERELTVDYKLSWQLEYVSQNTTSQHAGQ